LWAEQDCNGLPLTVRRSSDGNVHWSGTVGTSGTDAIIDTATIANGQIVTLLSFTHTQPA
jgi:hypothetical protein